MGGIKSLVKDTAIYGVSSIIGRFLNWWLVPLYTYRLAVGEFGDFTDLYAWMAILLVILTYGMETGFFRFANDSSEKDPQSVYSTCLFSLTFTTCLFFLLIFGFLRPISNVLGYAEHPEYIAMVGIIIGIDAFSALPFAYLRYRKRPVRFAAIKILLVVINIVFNIFFLVLCPKIWETNPGIIEWFYNPDYGVGYILVSNLIMSFLGLVLLIPEIVRIKWRFRQDLLKRILRYSFPLLILGIAGIMNQSLDKILLKRLISGEEAGIYNANYKIAVIMAMFIQAFRYAYEPFIFDRNKGEDKRKAYAEAMKYFIIFGLLIFLGVTFYLDIIRYVIEAKYHVGLVVVPIVLLAELFMGIVFNLSVWYKVTDRTQWGTWLTLMGLAVTVGVNLLFIPMFGYMASAWAAFSCYLLMMILSWLIGKRYYPINYNLKKIGGYALLTAALYVIAVSVPIENLILRLAFRTALITVYLFYVVKKDIPLKEIPYVNRFVSRKK